MRQPVRNHGVWLPQLKLTAELGQKTSSMLCASYRFTPKRPGQAVPGKMKTSFEARLVCLE